MITPDFEKLAENRKSLIKMRDLIDKNRLIELTDKFDTLLILMKNLAEIEEIISNQVIEMTELR